MKAHLSRRYRFSAAHRLHTEVYDAARNRAIYGKCNSPHGHGHNYIVQLTFSGTVDPDTGMVLDLAELDDFAQKNLLDRFDHTNLNLLDCFKTTVSTTENLAVEVHRLFAQAPMVLRSTVRLEHVHIVETNNNIVDFADNAIPAPRTI